MFFAAPLVADDLGAVLMNFSSLNRLSVGDFELG